jgi:hypothetical protein
MQTDVLTNTIDIAAFDSVFTKVGDPVSLGLPNAAMLHTYRLNAENCAFVFDGLHEYLIENIGGYIYSRMQIDKFETAGKKQVIAYKAIELLKKVYDFDESVIGDELGDILLYFFLEDKLKAPKLFSKIELAQNGSEIMNSYGVHLLPLGDNAHFQMVYGKSRIDGDIKDAIDGAFEYIEKIRDEGMSNYNIVDSGILDKSYDKATSESLASILIPKKSATVSMNKSFGLFLGYSLGLKTEGFTHDEFLLKMAGKMEDDIKAHKEYILDKIAKAKMKSYSFYVYVLPFNDASEKAGIMNRLLGR